MKNKELIIIFVIFMIVILLSLFITRQSQKAVFLSEKEASTVEQAQNQALSAYLKQASPASLPLIKSGITVIPTPSTALEVKKNQVPKIADQASNNISSSQNVASGTEEQDALPAAGITKIGKQPSPKEAKEMNSNGIVLY
jgi:type II secretory pathway pseudopilin PulG